MLLAFWIRIQGVEQFPPGQFTETDAYFYYWQAQLVSEHGRLPERDMHRWLPLGRDLGQTLNLYGYVLAYTHKAIAPGFPNVTLYHVALYMPVVCFCVGLGALCLFLYYAYGFLFSSVAGVLLATLPGSIERSTAGFGDRDAFCLMIGILALIIYLMSVCTERPHHKLLWTLASGFTVFLGGISWEGFGVFLSIMLCVELWRFLASETEAGLGHYLLWVLSFVPTLYFASPAYRSGYGFSEHLAVFVLVSPLILLGMRALRHLILSKVDFFLPHARTLALGLTLGSISLALSYIYIQHSTFADTTVSLSQNALMQKMTELRAPHFRYWVARYGTVFIFGSLGFVIIPLLLWKKLGLIFSIPMALFTAFSFFRQPLDKLWGEPFGNALFCVAMGGCVIALLFVAWQCKNKLNSSEIIFIAFTVWFLVWVSLSRDAKRYDFFIGVALAFGAAALIHCIGETLSERLWHSVYVTDKFRETFKPIVLKTGTATILSILLMFLPLQHAHTYRSLYAAKQMRKPIPGYTRVNAAFLWMKTFLVRKVMEKDLPIVAAHWAYGSQLNVIAGVKTIIDQDTYLQHWIYLYNQHVHNAQEEREVLEFLKTHGATHVLLTKKDSRDSVLRQQLSDAFVPVYPSRNFAESDVKIWEIHYPPDIESHPKYLKTGFPEIDKELQRQ